MFILPKPTHATPLAHGNAGACVCIKCSMDDNRQSKYTLLQLNQPLIYLCKNQIVVPASEFIYRLNRVNNEPVVIGTRASSFSWAAAPSHPCVCRLLDCIAKKLHTRSWNMSIRSPLQFQLQA
jgi:hypothetical protein